MILTYLKPGDEFKTVMAYDHYDCFWLYMGNTKPLNYLKPFGRGECDPVHKVRELRRLDTRTGKLVGMGHGPWLTSESWLRDSGYTTKESENGLEIGEED